MRRRADTIAFDESCATCRSDRKGNLLLYVVVVPVYLLRVCYCQELEWLFEAEGRHELEAAVQA